ncbi:unnamed protein product [Staurois parvus]|uniref:Uncharacterized protein n=1 Tax=Staurois parvus TaxID=386267 RepID=A0ABN9HT45_9NEOB|nr:unnamed protein product [Staurois parvus]
MAWRLLGPVIYPQSLVISCTVCSLLVIPCTVCSLLVIPCTVCSLLVISPVLSAVSGHLCLSTVSTVCGHLLYCVRSLWSSPVLSAVSGHLLYYVCSL